MDPQALMEITQKGVKGSILKINEGRQRHNLEPVDGGDDIYMQQQNYSLRALNAREIAPDTTGTPQIDEAMADAIVAEFGEGI